MAAIAIMAILSSRFLPMFRNGMQEADKIVQSGRHFSLMFKGEMISRDLIPECLKTSFEKIGKEHNLVLKVVYAKLDDEEKRNLANVRDNVFFTTNNSGNEEQSDQSNCTWIYYVP